MNKVMLLGNVGNDPEIRTMQNGGRVATFSLATSERWKDKAGERQERTQWHRIVVFNEALVGVVESYVRRGSKLLIEGQVESRKYTDGDGVERVTTEIVLRPYRGEMTLLDRREASDGEQPTRRPTASANPPEQPARQEAQRRTAPPPPSADYFAGDEFGDEVPF